MNKKQVIVPFLWSGFNVVIINLWIYLVSTSHVSITNSNNFWTRNLDMLFSFLLKSSAVGSYSMKFSKSVTTLLQYQETTEITIESILATLQYKYLVLSSKSHHWRKQGTFAIYFYGLHLWFDFTYFFGTCKYLNQCY